MGTRIAINDRMNIPLYRKKFHVLTMAHNNQQQQQKNNNQQQTTNNQTTTTTTTPTPTLTPATTTTTTATTTTTPTPTKVIVWSLLNGWIYVAVQFSSIVMQIPMFDG